jgi:hypothetical protein
MIAGDVARAVQLKDCYRQQFHAMQEQNKDKAPISIKQHEISDLLRKPIRAYMYRRANEHVFMKLGLGYENFLQAIEKKQIPESIAAETLTEISKLDFGCELIIAFFGDDREVYIYKVNEEGLEPCDNFAAIGSGCVIAEGVLYQRQHQWNDPIGPTVYRVYEAMTLGAISPTVGEENTINILYPPQRDRTMRDTMVEITERTDRFLERRFRKLGPRAFKRLALPKNPFEPA